MNQLDVGSEKLKIPDAILVLLVPLLGYVIAYAFELGYCSVFGIPVELVALNLSAIVKGILVILFGIWLLLFLTFTVKEHTARRLAMEMLFLAFLVALASQWLYSFAVWTIVVIWLATVYMRLTGMMGDNRSEQALSAFLQAPLAQLRKRYYAAVAAYVLVVALSYIAGIGTADNKHRFLVSSTSDRCVMLSIYGDTGICAPIKSTHKELTDRPEVLYSSYWGTYTDQVNEIEPSFYFYKIGDPHTPLLSLETIGFFRLQGKPDDWIHSWILRR